MEAPAEECSAAVAAAARVEALYASLPGGYDVDKEAATYDDNLTYGEMATADLALLCQRVRLEPCPLVWQATCSRLTDPQQVPRHAELDFVDLGSGIGKMVLAAAAVFRSAAGYEIAPERAAVAAAALARLGADGAAAGCCSCSRCATL